MRARYTRVCDPYAYVPQGPLPPFRRVRAAGKYRLSLKLPGCLAIDPRGEHFRTLPSEIRDGRKQKCSFKASQEDEIRNGKESTDINVRFGRLSSS